MNMKKTNMNINGFTQGLLLCAALVTSTNVVANPSGATVINGNVSFSQPNANTLNITNTPGAIINWQQFGISQGELTHFNQQSSSSTVLNRVVGQDPSKILGSLTSNGRVFLINPNGVMFGQNAIIDTAGLIASTLGMSDRDFLNGNLHFEDLTNAAEILNKGFIHTSNAGEVVLVAPNIRNEGTINVENGNLVLAAGQSVTVSSLNHKNITFEVQAPSNKVVNIGKLMSDGGSIGVFAGSITNSGVISANAITVNDAGQIVLLAKGDNIQQSGTVTATSNKGKGGHIEILGDRVGLFGKSIADASGKTGGGEVLVGGDYQGKTQSVKNAKQTVVSKDSEIHADAIGKGNGGKAIVWADGQTVFTGNITAKAGDQGGDGGFIEISGKQHLTYKGSVDASAKKGKAGTVLFDPHNLTIANVVAPTPPELADNLFAFAEPTAATDSTITAADITAITNQGTAVVLQANNDIAVNNAIITNNIAGNGGDITLQAGRSILINADITTDNGKLVLIANESVANGVVNAQRDGPVNGVGGVAEITQLDGTAINTGTGNMEVVMRNGTDKTNSVAGDITLGDVTTNDMIIVHNGATAGGSILSTLANPIINRIKANSLDINSGGFTQLNTSVNFVSGNSASLSGANTIQINNTGTSLDVTGFSIGVAGGQLFTGLNISNDGSIVVSGAINAINANVSLSSSSSITTAADIVLTVSPSILTNPSISLVATGINIGADVVITDKGGFNLDAGLGSLVITGANGTTLDIISSSGGTLSGADITISGGTTVGSNVNIGINSSVGAIGLFTNAGDLVIQGGTADNTGVVISANNNFFADISVVVAGDLNLIAGTGDNSSVSLEAMTGEATNEVDITAANINITNALAGLNSDAFINVSGGGGGANLNFSGSCKGCFSVNDPAGTAGTQIGIWASNFASGNIFFTNAQNNLQWDDRGNWSIAGVTPSVSNDVTISAGLFTTGVGTILLSSGSHTINSLVGDNALDILSGASLTVDGVTTLSGIVNISGTGTSATFNDTASFASDLTISNSATATFNNTLSVGGTFAVNNATATVNGLNNLVNLLTLTNTANLQGTGTTNVGGLFTWSDSTVAHNLNLGGGLQLVLGSGTATQAAGNITIAVGTTASIQDDFSIEGQARFINNGTVNLNGVNVNSVSGTGVFENNGLLKNVSVPPPFSPPDLFNAVFINNAGGTFDVGVANTEFTNSASRWNGGTFTGSTGEVRIGGDITLDTAAKKTIDGVLVSFRDTQLMRIIGDGDIDIINGGELFHESFNQFAATLSIFHESNGDITSTDGTGIFRNQGHFVNVKGDTTISAIFINDASFLPAVNNIEVQAGKLTIAGDFTNNNTNVLVTGGELVYKHMNASPLMDNASYNISGGTFSVESDTNFSGLFTNTGGAVRIANGATADFSSSGANFVANDLILDGGATITGSDSVAVNGTFSWMNGFVSNQFITLNNGGIANISASNATLTGFFSNNGQVNILNGAVLELTRFSEHNGGFDIASGGELFVFNETQIFNAAITGGGTIRVAEVTPGQQGGLVLLQNSNAGRLLMEGGFISGAGSLSLADLSTWSGGSFQTGGDINFNGGVDITGNVDLVRTVNIFGGSMTDVQLFDFSEVPGAQTFDGLLPVGVAGKFNIAGGNFVINGNSRIGSEVTISGGSLDIAGTLTAINGVSNTGGILQGTGTIVGNVINDAMLNPGNSPGTLTINGDLILLSSSVLNLEIAGSDLFDKLIVNGNMEFGGELAVFVDTTSGFSGALNDEFVPFQFGSSSGSFALVSAKPKGFGFEFDGLNLILTDIPGLSVLVPENDSLVFTNTLETFIDPFVDAGNKDADEEDDKEKTLVCS